VDGYIIQLSVPTALAPAYAAAARACPVSTVEEAKRPQYIYASDAQTHGAAAALAGPVQTQYPAYSYAAYGYDPSYGELLVLLQCCLLSAIVLKMRTVTDMYMFCKWAVVM